MVRRRRVLSVAVVSVALVALSACGGSDDYDKYNVSAARINAMCPKSGISQTSLTSDNGYQSVAVTCKSGKVGKIDSWDQPDQPAEGQEVVAP